MARYRNSAPPAPRSRAMRNRGASDRHLLSAIGDGAGRLAEKDRRGGLAGEGHRMGRVFDDLGLEAGRSKPAVVSSSSLPHSRLLRSVRPMPNSAAPDIRAARNGRRQLHLVQRPPEPVARIGVVGPPLFRDTAGRGATEDEAQPLGQQIGNDRGVRGFPVHVARITSPCGRWSPWCCGPARARPAPPCRPSPGPGRRPPPCRSYSRRP